MRGLDMRHRIIKKTILFAGLMAIVPANAFVTKANFFEELIFAKLKDVSNISVTEGLENPSEYFKKVLADRVFGDYQPELYQVSFNQDQDSVVCSGALIKESKRLTVSGLPVGFRDRSALVVMSDCRYNDEVTISNVIEYYQVYPLDTTLPIGSLSAIESYRLYQSLKTQRPNLLCTDNDMNSEGIPRAQLAIHEIEDQTTFYTGISRSSPAREINGEVIWSNDRALYIEEADQSSLPEVKATLDFVSLALKGHLLFNFLTEDCIKGEQDGLLVMTCESKVNPEIALVFQPDADYSEVPLTLTNVRATLQTRKVKRLLLGPNGNNQIIEDTDYDLSYFFKFSSDKGDRYLKANQKFRDTEIESGPECRRKL